VLVDVHRSQVTIEEQLVRLDVDGTLPPALGAEGPLRIYQAPECRSCNKIHYLNKRTKDSSRDMEILEKKTENSRIIRKNFGRF
jgi:hypothetical protein